MENAISFSKGRINQQVLDGLNAPQARDGNKENLRSLGGVEGLAKELGVNLETGLNDNDVEMHRRIFGTNEFPAAVMTTFLEFLFEALSDTTLIILMAAAVVSLIIGLTVHAEDNGWIEGAAILIAVGLVSTVASCNNYSKELQFRALETVSQNDERCTVIRNGGINTLINPKDIVVGDILLISAGDAIPADCIVCDPNVVRCNESSLTGEPEDLKKSRDGSDPFLLSSCLVTEGESIKVMKYYPLLKKHCLPSSPKTF